MLDARDGSGRTSKKLNPKDFISPDELGMAKIAGDKAGAKARKAYLAKTPKGTMGHGIDALGTAKVAGDKANSSARKKALAKFKAGKNK